MIKFITEPQPSHAPKFEDVKVNQFFICGSGFLAQKTTYNSFSVIAKADGTPFSDYYREVNDPPIKQILPIVTKIEFP